MKIQPPTRIQYNFKCPLSIASAGMYMLSHVTHIPHVNVILFRFVTIGNQLNLPTSAIEMDYNICRAECTYDTWNIPNCTPDLYDRRTCVHWKRDNTRPGTNLWQLDEKMKLKIGPMVQVSGRGFGLVFGTGHLITQLISSRGHGSCIYVPN